MIASMSSGAFRKDDCRRRNIEIHAGWSEAHQRIGILPILQEEKFVTARALLALSYHILYALFGCYLAAWLAPNRPMAHSVAVGGFGVVISTLGLIAIVAGGLAPAWYGWALVVLSLPVAWIGGKLSIWHFNRQKSGRFMKKS